MIDDLITFRPISQQDDLIECSLCHCILRSVNKYTHLANHVPQNINKPPELTPKLLVDMAEAINENHDKHTEAPLGLQPEEYHCLARAALAVVVKQMDARGYHSAFYAAELGIPESMVKEMLDE